MGLVVIIMMDPCTTTPNPKPQTLNPECRYDSRVRLRNVATGAYLMPKRGSLVAKYVRAWCPQVRIFSFQGLAQT